MMIAKKTEAKLRIHSELKSQHKAREQVATITVHYYGLSINSVFHDQGAPEGRWAEQNNCLTRNIFGSGFLTQ